MHPIMILVQKYPQIRFPIEEGIKDTVEYQDVCLRGKPCERVPEFSYSEYDTLEEIMTEAGVASVLTLHSREDFERIIQCLFYRCEPAYIPASMGACTIKGLNNWDKVRAGEKCYKDTLIVLSSGIYSNVCASDVASVTKGRLSLSNEEWIQKSKVIRKYHELRHFVDRTLRPEDIDPLRDEINADRDGIIAAFGYYDKDLARIFLGIEGDVYRNGGRLQNYLPDTITIEAYAETAREIIENI